MVGSRRYSLVWIVLAVAVVVVVSSSSGGLGTNDGATRIVVEAFQQQQPRPQSQPRNQQRLQNNGRETVLLSRRTTTTKLRTFRTGSSQPWLQSLTSLSSTNGEEDPSLSSAASTTTNNANGNDPNPPAFDSVTTKESEKALRNEIATRNSIVDNEEQYTIRDGAGISSATTTVAASAAVVEESTNSAATGTAVDTSSSSSTTQAEEEPKDEFEKTFEKIIRQRPYPLFLLEKGIEIVEDTVEGIRSKFGNTVPADDLSIRGGSSSGGSLRRERVVVLGTGWGAAAFVKDIDTSRYDVTVISPRNYFLFTPMLAGASVGTVDYRSITQPIREVRILTSPCIIP